MDSLPGTVRANNEAVIREWREAWADDNVALAHRIVAANPDLFDDDGEPLWHRS
jgi:hypothetical protein